MGVFVIVVWVDVGDYFVDDIDVSGVNFVCGYIDDLCIDQQQIKWGFIVCGLYGVMVDLSIVGYNYFGIRIMWIFQGYSKCLFR